MLTALIVAAILITLAELGDKTQIMALVLAARYGAWQVLAGILGATLVLTLLATAAGRAIGGLVPHQVLALVTGLLFVGFGVWTLRGAKDDTDEAPSTSRFGPIVTTAVAFFLAELGDKTQIMTMTIAADPGAALRTFGGFASGIMPFAQTTRSSAGTFLGVWIGSTLGMMIADGIAIILGSVAGKRLPARLITRVSGVAFVLFGLATLAVEFLG